MLMIIKTTNCPNKKGFTVENAAPVLSRHLINSHILLSKPYVSKGRLHLIIYTTLGGHAVAVAKVNSDGFIGSNARHVHILELYETEDFTLSALTIVVTKLKAKYGFFMVVVNKDISVGREDAIKRIFNNGRPIVRVIALGHRSPCKKICDYKTLGIMAMFQAIIEGRLSFNMSVYCATRDVLLQQIDSYRLITDKDGIYRMVGNGLDCMPVLNLTAVTIAMAYL